MAGHTRKTPINPYVGACIALGRLRKKLTQVELAKKIGCTGANISHYERARSDPPRSTMVALGKVLDLPDEVVTGEGGDERDKAFVALCLQAAREGGPELLAVVDSFLPALIKANRSGALPELAERIRKSLG